MSASSTPVSVALMISSLSTRMRYGFAQAAANVFFVDLKSNTQINKKVPSPNTGVVQAAGNGRREMRRTGREKRDRVRRAVTLGRNSGSVGKEGWFIFVWADKNAAKARGVAGIILGEFACQRTAGIGCQSKWWTCVVQNAAYSEKLSGSNAAGKFRYFSTSASLSLTPAIGCSLTKSLWFS